MPNDPTKSEKGSITDQQMAESNTLKQDLLIRVENAIKLNELEAERAEMLGQQLTTSQQQLEISQNLTTMAASELKSLLSQSETLGKTVERAAALQGILEKIADRQLEGAESQKEYARIMENIKKLSENQEMSQENITKELKKQYDALEALNAKQKDVKEFSRLANQEISGMAKKFGITADLSGTTSGNLAKLAANLKTGLSADKLTQIGNSLSQLSAGMLASLADEIGKIAVATQKLGDEFQRTNALAIDFKDAMFNAYKASFELGVSQEDVSKSFQDIQDNMTRFNLTNKETYETLSDGILLFGRFGISTATAGKSMDLLARQFKLNEKQAIEMYKGIAFAGKDVGITAKKMTEDFAKAYDKISAYGAEMEEVFYDLAKQSKDTGLEMDKLLSISEKFDTFEGASTQVAKLNSILGVSLSSVDMMYATADERIDMLTDAVNGAGVAFEDMGYYQQKFIAEAMGVSGPAEAMRLLSGEGDEYLEQLKENEESIAKLKEEAMKLVPFMTRIGMVMVRVALMFETPIKILTKAMDLFLAASTATGGYIEVIFFGIFTAMGPLLGVIIQHFSTFMLLLKGVGFVEAMGAALAWLSKGFLGFFGILVGGYLIVQGFFDMIRPSLMKIKGFVGKLMEGAAIVIKTLALIGVVVLAIFTSPIWGTASAWAVGIAGAIGAIVIAFQEFSEMLSRRRSPPFWELLSKWIPEGIAAMALGANLAKQAISSFGAVLLSVYKTAIKPFISGFSAIASVLGFDMADDSPIEPGVGKPATPSDGTKTTNATLAAAATEVKSIVVAQLRETGIQETANELAKIAKTLTDIKMVNDVKVYMDGDQIGGRVVEKLVG